jgi:hypothetical protein
MPSNNETTTHRSLGAAPVPRFSDQVNFMPVIVETVHVYVRTMVRKRLLAQWYSSTFVHVFNTYVQLSSSAKSLVAHSQVPVYVLEYSR